MVLLYHSYDTVREMCSTAYSTDAFYHWYNIILPNTESFQLGRSYTACLWLVFGGSSAPPIQPLPLPALSLSGLITSSAAVSKVPRSCNLLLRRPSYNCCSGGHHTIAAPAAIAPASSSSSISASIPTRTTRSPRGPPDTVLVY